VTRRASTPPSHREPPPAATEQARRDRTRIHTVDFYTGRMNPTSSASITTNLTNFTTRQIEKYTGETIVIQGRSVYECCNWLGAGASGSVYHGIEVSTGKGVAIKILNPIGYKLLPANKVSSCIVLARGQPLSINKEEKNNNFKITLDNVWWIFYEPTKQIIAAYEDPNRRQLREIALPKCLELWGWSPLGADKFPYDVIERKNVSATNGTYKGMSINVPLVPSKYLKWLYSRQAICKEMVNMIHVGGTFLAYNSFNSCPSIS